MYFCLFCAGLHNRQVGSHMMNDHSSRSHSMLTVYIDIESVRLTFIFDTLSSPLQRLLCVVGRLVREKKEWNTQRELLRRRESSIDKPFRSRKILMNL